MRSVAVVLVLSIGAACTAAKPVPPPPLEDNPAWEGDYRVGSSFRLSATLSASRRSGLTYQQVSDVLGASWQKTFPIVEATRDRIVIDLGDDPGTSPGLSRCYVYASWGSSEFLVPEQEMSQFGAWVSEPAHLTANGCPFPRKSYLWWATSSAEPLPTPVVPRAYEKYLTASATSPKPGKQ